MDGAMNPLAVAISQGLTNHPKLEHCPRPIVDTAIALTLEAFRMLLDTACGPLAIEDLVDEDFVFCEGGGICRRTAARIDDDGTLCPRCAEARDKDEPNHEGMAREADG